LSFEALSLITNRAKQRFQESIRLGFAIQVAHFVVGSQGHDPNSPITALTPDPGYDPSPDASGHRIPSDATMGATAITSATDDPDFVTRWVCTVPAGTATGEVSSIYLLAKVVYPVTHADYDLFFVWSVGYMPLSVKVDNESRVYEVGVAY